MEILVYIKKYKMLTALDNKFCTYLAKTILVIRIIMLGAKRLYSKLIEIKYQKELGV